MCCPSPSAHLLRSSQRAAPFPHRKGPRCNNTGDEDESGVETAHGCIFVAVFDYLQSERLKHGYKILTSWREPGFLLTSGSWNPQPGRRPSSSSLSSSTATPKPLTERRKPTSEQLQICETLPCSSAWSGGPRDFTIFDARPVPSRTCGVPPAPGHHRTGRGAPVLWSDFLPVGRAIQLSS